MKKLVIVVLPVIAAVYGYLYFVGFFSVPTSRQSLSGLVTSVSDGDTIKLRTDDGVYTIQMTGIDAPEFGQRFAEHSRNYLFEMVSSKTVIVEVTGQDSNGDLIGELFLEGLSINKLMLTDGFAWAIRGLSAESNWGGLEHIAREQRFGLWRDETVVAPWKFRKDISQT